MFFLVVMNWIDSLLVTSPLHALSRYKIRLLLIYSFIPKHLNEGLKSGLDGFTVVLQAVLLLITMQFGLLLLKAG